MFEAIRSHSCRGIALAAIAVATVVAALGFAGSPAAAVVDSGRAAWISGVFCPPMYRLEPPPVALSGLVQVCQQYRFGNWLWIHNTSRMSMRVTYGANRLRMAYVPPTAREDSLTSAVLAYAQADGRAGRGFVILPADAAVQLSGPTDPRVLVDVRPDTEHTQRALIAREAAAWFGFGLGKAASADYLPAQVGQCALDAIELVNARELPNVREAIDQAQGCQDAAEGVASLWDRRPSTSTPTADDILTRVTTGFRRSSSVMDDILGQASRLARLHPRL